VRKRRESGCPGLRHPDRQRLCGNIHSTGKGTAEAVERSRDASSCPSLLHYEIIAVSRKAVHQGRISQELGWIARDQLLTYPVILHFDRALLRRGYEIAEEFNRPTAYDAQYLALAERLSCSFWTADERLFNAVSSKLSSIH
jgi:predicted nucleic acid-binding protein